jgi:hypothetical protein
VAFALRILRRAANGKGRAMPRPARCEPSRKRQDSETLVESRR